MEKKLLKDLSQPFVELAKYTRIWTILGAYSFVAFLVMLFIYGWSSARPYGAITLAFFLIDVIADLRQKKK